jgi:tripartite-type tricarboxylate transporter receptor subunit TctC
LLVGALVVLLLTVGCGAEAVAPPTATPIDTGAIVQQAVQEALSQAEKQLDEDTAAAAKARKAEADAAAEDLFKGKTIRLLIGYSAGGGYDTYGRAIARHFGKHIPGNPEIVVDQMTGAGSLIAANYLYNQAKPDGLTMGLWNSGHIFQEALHGNPGILFSGERFGYLGAPSNGNPVCAIMAKTGLKTLADVQGASGLKFGATGAAGSALADVPKILNKWLGTDIKVVSGYKGSSKVRLAIQEHEVDGACWGWESMSVTGRAMLDATGDDEFIPFAVTFAADDPELKGLPVIGDEIKDPAHKALLKVWATGYEFQRPYTLPPGTSEEIMGILSTAYAATMADPAFLADANQAKLYLLPRTRAETEGWVAEMLRMSSDTRAELQFLAVNPR